MSRSIVIMLINSTRDYPACRYCTWLIFRWCIQHEAEVPADFLNKRNECKFFKDGLDDEI